MPILLSRSLSLQRILLVLLRGQAVPTDFGNVSFNVGELPSVALGSVWAAWLSSDYGIGRFSIGVPVSSPSAEQFRIRMELLQWRWKLTGVGLPELVAKPVWTGIGEEVSMN